MAKRDGNRQKCIGGEQQREESNIQRGREHWGEERVVEKFKKKVEEERQEQEHEDDESWTGKASDRG